MTHREALTPAVSIGATTLTDAPATCTDAK